MYVVFVYMRGTPKLPEFKCGTRTRSSCAMSR